MPRAVLLDPPSCKAVPGIVWDRLQRAYTAVCAERDALAARVRELEAVLFLGHSWEPHEGAYRCTRCGLQALHPRRVQLTCEQWQRERADGRRKRKGAGSISENGQN